MPCWFGEDDFLRVQVQKRRRSGLYAEYFAPVLSENQTSETVRYLVWVILVQSYNIQVNILQNNYNKNVPIDSLLLNHVYTAHHFQANIQ